jgi:hypothetical protein
VRQLSPSQLARLRSRPSVTPASSNSASAMASHSDCALATISPNRPIRRTTSGQVRGTTRASQNSCSGSQ